MIGGSFQPVDFRESYHGLKVRQEVFPDRHKAERGKIFGALVPRVSFPRAEWGNSPFAAPAGAWTLRTCELKSMLMASFVIRPPAFILWRGATGWLHPNWRPNITAWLRWLIF